MKGREPFNRQKPLIFPPDVMEELYPAVSIGTIMQLLEQEKGIPATTRNTLSENHWLVRNTIAKATKERGGDWTTHLRAPLIQAVVEEMDAESEIIEIEMEVVEASLRLLIHGYTKGKLRISSNINHKDVKRCERQSRILGNQLVLRRSMKSQLAGEVVDKILRDSHPAKYRNRGRLERCRCRSREALAKEANQWKSGGESSQLEQEIARLACKAYELRGQLMTR